MSDAYHPHLDANGGDLHIDCTRTVLDNGLVLLVHEDHDAPQVSLSICYRVGSKDERHGQTGSAHLFEHLMFTGSANLPGMFSTTLTSAGATMVNAYTTPDLTCFFETFPPGVLAFALYAEADRMGSFRDHLTLAALAQQQAIVLEEKAQRAGVPLGTLPEIIRANLYPKDHPYHHPVIGSTQDIAGMTLEQARAWHARFYTPDNAVIVIGGPIEREGALDLVRAHFSHIAPSGRGTTAQRWIPAVPARRRVRLEAPVSHGGLVHLIWPVVEASDPDLFGLELAAAVLADDNTGPLHRALVGAGGCLHVSAAVVPGEVCSEFTVSLTLATGTDVDQATLMARTTIAAALSSTLHDDAFDRFRARERNRLALAVDHLQTAVGVLTNGEMLWRDPLHYLAEIDAIEATDADALRVMARRWLATEPLVIEVHPKPTLTASAAATRRPPMPEIREDRREDVSPEFVQSDDPSGLRTIDVPRPGARDFVLRLDLNHGSESETAAVRGICALVATMPHHGIGAIDPIALRQLQDRIGLTMNVGCSPTAFVVEMHGPAAAAETAAALLNDLVLAPRFDDAVTSERKREQVSHLREAQADPMVRFPWIAPALLYGADAAGVRDAGGSAATVAAITPDSLHAYHRRLFDPAGATLFAAGAGDTLQILGDRLASLRASWTSPRDPLPSLSIPTLPVREASRIHLVAGGPDDQAIVTMAMLLPVPANIADEAAARALGFVLERRLVTRLRDELHWTYGVSARPVDAIRPDLPPRLEIGGAVNAEHVGEVMAEIAGAVAGLADMAPPTPAEIGDYVSAARAGITGSVVSTGGRVAAVAMAVRPYRPADIRMRLDALDQLDVDTIVRLARRACEAGPVEWVVASTARDIAFSLGATGKPIVAWTPD